MKLLPSLCAAAMLCAPLLPAHAETKSFRCKNDLVNVGDGKASALMKCGEPLVRDSFCAPAENTTTTLYQAPTPPVATTVITVAACTPVDHWTYNPGFGQFMTTLRFESGKLTAITYGDRVK